MKVKLTIELDLPDNTPLVEGHERASLGELLSDTYVNYATRSHLEDALKWCVKSSNNKDDVGAEMIFKHHDLWGDICAKAKWDFEVLK